MHPNAGRKQSAEHIQKRVNAIRASGAYARNGVLLASRNKVFVGTKHTKEHNARISAMMKGKRNSLGTKRSVEYRQRLSDYWTNNPAHNHWVDGKSGERHSERIKDMGRLEYRLWREAVFKRDNWTCVFCGQRGGKLEADHIKAYATHPELRGDVDNGRTVCKPCHKTTDTYCGRTTTGSMICQSR
mgnify:CR=1 FL=1